MPASAGFASRVFSSTHRGARRNVLGLGAGLATLIAAAGFLPVTTAAAAPQPAPAAQTDRPDPHHLSSRLAAVAAPALAHSSRQAQAHATSTRTRGAGSLLHTDAGHLLVNIRVAAPDAATRARLRAAGARITFVATKLHQITAAVAPSNLRAVGDTSGVQYVGDILTPQLNAVCDSTISEGDGILKANLARSNFGVTGAGVKVGILSDSFNTSSSSDKQATDVASDNLPGSANTCGHTSTITPLIDQSGGADEGRGMAQTVHDLAPGASLAFETAFNGEASFAANIQALKNAGASVIVDDVSYFDEPFYQDGIISNAITNVVNGGATYFSSAANNNLIFNGHNVDSYEAVNGYRPTTCPTMVGLGETLEDCHNFNPSGAADSTFGMTVGPGQTIEPNLQWAEPLEGVKTDFDMVLINTATGAVLAGSTSDNINSEDPFELFSWTNPGGSALNVSLVIGRFSTPNQGTPRFKFVFMENGLQPFTALERQVGTAPDVMGPTIFGHNGAASAVSVAAEDVRNAPSTPVDYYSSRGPVTLLFNPVTGTTTPATPLPSPLTLNKPDVTASDCVKNTFFGGFDGQNWRFCGTSDAAPHGAAVAALIKQADPAATPAQIINAIKSTATPINGFTADAMGAGLIDANAAVGSLAAPTNDFSLKLAPTTLIVTPSSSRPVTVTTAVVSGSAAPVTLSASGQPSGVTVSFSPNPVTAGSSSTMTVTAGANVTSSTKTVTVKGVEGTKSHTAKLTLTVHTNTGPLANGGFDTGNLVPWTPVGVASIVTSGAQAGKDAALLGSSSPSTDSSISQTFTVGATAKGLKFYYKQTCPDTVSNDWATATLVDNTAATTTTVLEKTCKTTAYQMIIAPVTGGHNYTLTFANHDNNTPNTATRTTFDSVSITAGGFVNGTFEAGSLLGWTPVGVATATMTSPQAGLYDAQLGSSNPSTDSSIAQTWLAPSAVTVAHFYYDNFCHDTVADDWVTATLTDNTTSTTSTVLAHTCTTSPAWTKASFSVTAGHSYTLTLTNHDNNDPSTASFTRIDSIGTG
jgi:hypothetical protein